MQIEQPLEAAQKARVHPTPAKAFAAHSATTPLESTPIVRRPPGPHDVEMEILFCGVCHSDIHTARSEWGPAKYPCVPGHEIVGRVTRVGAHVFKHQVGDTCAVGCMVDSCRSCANCAAGLENYCTNGATYTYNSADKHLNTHTLGGYSSSIVVDEAFVLRVPAGLDLAATAPLLCAGITTYSPLRHWKVGPGMKVGIIGLGGLGHMGLKFAKAFGAHVVLFTTSPKKVEDGKRLGAQEVVLSTDTEAMNAHKSSFDFILDCVSAEHDINAYLQLVKLNGTLTTVGAPEKPLPVSAFSLIAQRRSFAGSGIGSIAETQEMLDFCAEHGITPEVEMIRMDGINEAWERMLKQDVRYRFVIDMASLKEDAAM